MEYERLGYLPEAMVNFLSLLGWSPSHPGRAPARKEIFTRDELVRAFTLDGISGGDAVFNTEKLDWFNAQHIARLAPDDLAARLKPWFEAAGLWNDEFLASRHAWFFAVLELLRPRAKRLGDFIEVGNFFFADGVQYDPAAVEKHLRAADMDEHIGDLDAAWSALPTFDTVSLESTLRGLAEARSVKAATLIHAVRVALTGRTVSPGLFEVASLLGRERTHARLAAARRLISSPTA